MVVASVHTFVVGWQKEPPGQIELPPHGSPGARTLPLQEPHDRLDPLQTLLWQLLARAQDAPAGSRPGLKHDGRTDRSRSVHESCSTSAAQPAEEAIVRVEEALKK
jgi:hypothetical protein